jgi:hypothetical protein
MVVIAMRLQSVRSAWVGALRVWIRRWGSDEGFFENSFLIEEVLHFGKASVMC